MTEKEIEGLKEAGRDYVGDALAGSRALIEKMRLDGKDKDDIYDKLCDLYSFPDAARDMAAYGDDLKPRSEGDQEAAADWIYEGMLDQLREEGLK